MAEHASAEELQETKPRIPYPIVGDWHHNRPDWQFSRVVVVGWGIVSGILASDGNLVDLAVFIDFYFQRTVVSVLWAGSFAAFAGRAQ